MEKIRQLAEQLEHEAAELATAARAKSESLESIRERTMRLVAESAALIDRANQLLAESQGEPS